MTNPGKEQHSEGKDHPAIGPARPPYAQASSDFSEALKLNPLMANPAAAMAAATAIGFGFATQMAGAFFGALQGAMEAGNREKAAGEVPAAPAPSQAPVASEIPAPAAELPMMVEPVVAALAAEPAPVVGKPKAKSAVPVRKPAVVVEPVKAPPVKAAGLKYGAAKVTAPKVPDKPMVEVVAVKTKARATKPMDTHGDLKRISGVGPKLEEVLKGLGVTSLKQIAAWKDADIARFDAELGVDGRIRRDDWVGQAKALLG